MSTSVLILGATGFVGVPFVEKLLADSSSHVQITALVRSSSKARDHLQDPSIKFVEGDVTTPEGLAIATSLSAQADLVVDNVYSAAVGPTEAAIAGLKKRHEETGRRGKLIHVSGAANFMTPAPKGKPVNRRTWNDAVEDDISGITPATFNGAADVAVLKAGQEGYLDTYIVTPSGIYGGSAKRLGIFQEIFFNGIAHLRYVPYNGPGENEFGFVHVNDIAELLLLVLKKALSEERATGTVYSRYYIATKDTYSWKQIADNVAPYFYNKGLVDSAEPRSVDVSAVDVGALQLFLTYDVSLIANNAKSLGWIPKGPSFEEVVPSLLTDSVVNRLKHQGDGQRGFEGNFTGSS